MTGHEFAQLGERRARRARRDQQARESAHTDECSGQHDEISGACIARAEEEADRGS